MHDYSVCMITHCVSTAALAFVDIISKMPYGALPVVSNHQQPTILEYPAPVLQSYATEALDTTPASETRARGVATATVEATGDIGFKKISEGALDAGHRHFSHLHWLYPGLFLPQHPHSSNGGAIKTDEYTNTAKQIVDVCTLIVSVLLQARA